MIPYFQREAGILRKALASVARQTADADFTIIVVDDASPAPVCDEIAAVNLPSNVKLELVSVPNSGPGAARNVGLDTAHTLGMHYIGFLDSDDEWLPAHIEIALQGLNGEPDFYFCDHRRVASELEDEAVTFAFNWPNRENVSGITKIASVSNLYYMPAEVAFSEFLKSYLAQTSTVVFRAARYSEHRFSAQLRSAGEDHFMWLNMIKISSGVAFSTSQGVVCGAGINLYFSAFDWALPATRDRFGYLLLFYALVFKSFQISPALHSILKEKQKPIARIFGYLVLKQAMKRNLPPATLMKSLIRTAPEIIIALPVLAIQQILNTKEGRAL